MLLSCRAAWAGFVLGAGCSCGVPRRLAPVHRCARSVCGVVCTVSWAPRLLFTGVHALRVVSRVRRPGPPGSCSPVCTFCVWCCVYGVLGLPAPVHRCARSVRGVARTVSWASRLLFTGAHALRVVVCVRCPGPPGSCSLVRTLCVLCCVYGVLGLPAPVHRCARSVCGVACTASWASRLLFAGVHALCVVLRVRCPGLPGSCSPVRTPCVWCCVYGVLGLPGSCSPVRTPCVWCCVYGVLGLPAPVHRCARSVCGVACTVCWASWLLFTGVHALCAVLRVRRPGPPGSCSPVCTPCVWCCVYGVLGSPAPVHRCARPVCGVVCTVSWASLAPVHRCTRPACGVVCTVSWASRLLFTGVHALCAVLRVRCAGPPGSCSPVCTLRVRCCVYGVLGLPAPVRRCARPVCGVACTASWASRLLFTGVHALCVVLRVRCPGLPGSCSPVRTPCVWCCVYGVLHLPAPVHRCVRSVCGVACTVSWASRLLFTGVHALCVVLCVRCPAPSGSCSPVCTLCAWCCVYGVLGPPAPVHRCARSACGVACTVSWASRLLFTGVHALRVVLSVRCPGPPGSCSPVRMPCVWCCVYGVLGLPSPVHRCVRSVCDVARTASWASRLLFTGVHALCVVLRVRCPGPPGSCSPVCTLCVRVRCPGPPGSCSPVCTLCVWWCVYGVLGLLAPVDRCARSVCGGACAVSWAIWLVFTGVHALCVVLCVRCPGPPGSCSPVRTPCVWCCVYGVQGLPAPVHRCARSVCGVACTVCWASRLLFTGVHALCAVLRVRRPGPPGSCSPVCTPCVWCCVYGVLGSPAPVHRCARPVCGVVCTVSWASLAPVHRCARPACGVVCTVSWASRLLFTGVHALCAVLRVRCAGPPGSCSPVCTLRVRCCVYGVLGLPAPVRRCARPVCGVACTASWASRLLFTGVHALCVVLRVRCPGLPGSCSPVGTPCVWCCVYGVLHLPAPVHRCVRSVCGVACTVSWASRLLFTGVHALRVVLCVRCPAPSGSCSPVCTLCAWCCVYGVLGPPAPVHRCARSVCGVVCTVSCAFWLLFTGAHALRVVLCVRCPGPPGSCSPVCTLRVRCCVYRVLGLPAPVHRCARSACGVVCTVSCAFWLLFTGVHALCVVLRVRCPGPPCSCSPVCTLCVWCCVYGVLGLPAPVHRCARSARGVVCTVSWASRLLFTGAHALRVVLRVRCPGPPVSCSPVCTLCVWCRAHGVLGLPAPVHRCARSVCGVACTVSWASRLLLTGVHALCACAVSWASRLLFTGVHALCVVVRVRRPGPPGSRSPVCTLCVWWCVCGVLGHLARVHRCARSVCGVVCTVSWASWLLFTGVHALRVVLRVPFGPFALVWCVLCCACGVLGHLVRVLRCCGVLRRVWCPVCGVACAVSWASRPLFTVARARCVAWCVRCGCGCVLACAIPWPRRCGLFLFAETFFFTHCFLWRLIYSSRLGLFDFGDAQE